jgi:hypothetical protein
MKYYPGIFLERLEKNTNSIRITDVPAEIRTEYNSSALLPDQPVR